MAKMDELPGLFVKLDADDFEKAIEKAKKSVSFDHRSLHAVNAASLQKRMPYDFVSRFFQKSDQEEELKELLRRCNGCCKRV